MLAILSMALFTLCGALRIPGSILSPFIVSSRNANEIGDRLVKIRPSNCNIAPVGSNINHCERISAEQGPNNAIRIIHECDDESWLQCTQRLAQYDIHLPADMNSDTFDRFCRDIQHSLQHPGHKHIPQEYSNFLSLNCRQISDFMQLINQPTESLLFDGIDAVEMRIDLLDCYDTCNIIQFISALRMASNNLPIIYTVRSVEQLGTFPRSVSDPQRLLGLLEIGLRSRVEWLDIEADLPSAMIEDIISKRNSLYPSTGILGSYHTRKPIQEMSTKEIEELFQYASLENRADLIKVVTGAVDDRDCYRLQSIAEDISNRYSKPVIAVCLGEAGSLSRVINKCYTPVTHERMVATAPGQLTATQLKHQRELLGLVPPKQYYLFGKPLIQSRSPAMHNTAFRRMLLPHKYSLAQRDSVECYPEEFFSNKNITTAVGNDFGGASVTIPYKESIMKYLDEIDEVAKEIGAVNTIVLKNCSNGETKLVGYNTDWIGIKRPIDRLLLDRQSEFNERRIGLVLGAGGTARAACYAVQSMGLKLLIWNRTPEKAIELADMYHGSAVTWDDLKALQGNDIAVIISTVPSQADLTVPENLLSAHPVVLDVIYKQVTPLQQQAKAYQCPVVIGDVMLLEQGVEQFKLWTDREPPVQLMKEAIASWL